MTSRGHVYVSAAVIFAVALNILISVYNYGRLTQAVYDLTGRVARLELTIDNWRRGLPPTVQGEALQISQDKAR